MTAELIELAHRVKWDHTKEPPAPRLPAGLPADLKQAVKDDRDTFIAAAMNRYQQLPPEDACPLGGLPGPNDFTPDEISRLVKYVSAQGDMVNVWTCRRAEVYFSKNGPQTPPTMCCLAGVRDLIVWQHAHRQDPIGFVLGFGKDE